MLLLFLLSKTNIYRSSYIVQKNYLIPRNNESKGNQVVVMRCMDKSVIEIPWKSYGNLVPRPLAEKFKTVAR